LTKAELAWVKSKSFESKSQIQFVASKHQPGIALAEFIKGSGRQTRLCVSQEGHSGECSTPTCIVLPGKKSNRQSAAVAAADLGASFCML